MKTKEDRHSSHGEADEGALELRGFVADKRLCFHVSGVTAVPELFVIISDEALKPIAIWSAARRS
jgi:hypothetical protein